MAWAYYNEIDPFAAEWLRRLIAAGEIAPGVVDERSIAEVQPDELQEFTQCHFFAGIGGWSLAGRLGGWPDDRELWTGSCPCQPFSVAGLGRGYADERHLWPEFARLIEVCRPPVVAGEQVASKAGRAWIAGVRADLEAMGYGVGAADLCAASVGAPHIRQRLFWMAHSDPDRLERVEERDRGTEGDRQAGQFGNDADGRGVVHGGLGHAFGEGLEGHPGHEHPGHEPGRIDPTAAGSASAAGGDCWLGNTSSPGTRRDGRAVSGAQEESGRQWVEPRRFGDRSVDAGPVDPWSDAIWTPCADGKARRIEPGIEPLVDGVPGRVGRLRAYGNAIVPQVATEFLAAVIEITG